MCFFTIEKQNISFRGHIRKFVCNILGIIFARWILCTSQTVGILMVISSKLPDTFFPPSVKLIKFVLGDDALIS